MSQTDSLMKLSVSNQGQEMTSKASLFCTRRFLTICFIKTNNTLLEIIQVLSLLVQSQTQSKEKLLLHWSRFFQELASDHLYPLQLQRRSHNFANLAILLLESVFSTEILVKVV